ncbi:hypothetical protein B0H17DRAFT_1138659 [Mycena rosella]|uniref:Uncharacterized protein n=1 Tax=Mycena rosella TaxID=1033263 RepID=A0AAD7D697_MYCRO|nr:hypothetical protein B0H17DRAFT_1138659 [Mycena rosella]
MYTPSPRSLSFRKGLTRPIEWRKHQFLQLARMMQDNGDAFAESLAKDLGKPRIETYFSEIPLLGAIAAGCCAGIKPSELAPHYAELLADLLPKYLDSNDYRVMTGAVAESTKLLEFQCTPRSSPDDFYVSNSWIVGDHNLRQPGTGSGS